MKYEEILKVLAPCGLDCSKCCFNSAGEIHRHSTALKELLGSFDGYASRFSRFWPEFEHYPAFKTILERFTGADCLGCRQGTCRYPNCGVAPCYRDRGVDFCFQCGEYPCDRTNFDENLHRRWLRMNDRMKKIGVEAFYDETRGVSRYV